MPQIRPKSVQAVFFDAGRFKGGDTTPLGTEFSLAAQYSF